MQEASKDSPDESPYAAEVLTATITGFSAQLPQQAQTRPASEGPPRFGSFVRVDSDCSIFAVVLDVVTAAGDAVHRPAALGLSRERLRAEQPQIFALLKTEIQCRIVGFAEGGAYCLYLPPGPPRVHDFVRLARPDEIIAITEDCDYLRLLASTVQNAPVDELLAAAVREAARARSNEARENYLVEAGRALAQIVRGDYERLVSLLKKIKPIA